MKHTPAHEKMMMKSNLEYHLGGIFCVEFSKTVYLVIKIHKFNNNKNITLERVDLSNQFQKLFKDVKMSGIAIPKCIRSTYIIYFYNNCNFTMRLQKAIHFKKL